MSDVQEIKIGTRASRLAIAQAQEVKDLLIQSHPQYHNSPDLIKIITFKTTGDKIANKSLIEIGGKGLFIKEIEEALLNDKVDFAVHSMKDMPAFFNDNLEIFAVPQRKDVRDAFISNFYSSIDDLPENAVIGTSSPRRKALILHKRPDLKIVNFRGNIDTRLQKLQEKQVDATILAAAGFERIAIKNKITAIIDESEMLPAIGQGALALQAKKDNDVIANLLKTINHQNSEICINAERAFLETINGSCNTPLAGYCKIIEGELHLNVLLASLDGAKIYHAFRKGGMNEAIKIGRDAGEEIKKDGKIILDDLVK